MFLIREESAGKDSFDTDYICLSYQLKPGLLFGWGQRNMAQPGIDFFCSFSLFAQRKEPKENTPVSLGPSGTLRALKSAGSLKTRWARTVQTPYTADFRVLSYVPMGIEQQPL